MEAIGQIREVEQGMRTLNYNNKQKQKGTNE